MSLIAKKSTAVREPVPAGTHVAILYSIIDLGTQTIVWQGVEKTAPKARFTFELCNETKEFDGVEKPLVISNEYTVSFGDKANLTKIVEGMLGRKLTEAETQEGIDLKTLVGKVCMLNVVHKETPNGTYANIASVVPLVKGMEAPKQFNPSMIFELDNFDHEKFNTFPQFIKDKINSSLEMKKTEVGDASDVPF
jgi:hypothetical protein